MEFQEIISANRALLARARELNIRAGSEVFPIPTRQMIAEAVKIVLGGARRVAEIRNMSGLMLPALDECLVKKILVESPDTISVLGREVVVEYRSGYNPRVRIDFRGDESRDWLKLPDDGIRLPGGREVDVYSALEGYWYYIEANSSHFKAKARECLNQGLWEKWQKPELSTPTGSIPPIMEMEYGRCVVTNVELMAYGTVNYDSWYGSWKSYWSRDRAEIERIHAQACEKFAEVEAVVAVIEKRKAEAKRKQCEAEARREAVNTALEQIGWAEAHIWVPESGKVAYVLAGKTSKMGNFVVQPAADVDDDTSYNDRPYCFGDYKYQAWKAFRFDVKSKAQDYSSRGNLQSEVTLFVPKGLLPAGVYGVGADDEGQFFFPVIHHSAAGEEVIPEIGAIRKVRVTTKESKISAQAESLRSIPDALEVLRQKWGAR